MIEARTIRLLMNGVSTLCLLLALGVASTSAARPPFDRPDGPGPGPGPGFLTEHAEELGVDTSTREAIREIFESSREAAREQHAAIQEAHRAMRELLESDSPQEAEVMAQAERIGALELTATKHRLSTMLKVHALLTPEQRAKLVEMREQRREGRWERRLGRLDEGCAEAMDELCGDARRGLDTLSCLRDKRDELAPACRESLRELRGRRRHHRDGPS